MAESGVDPLLYRLAAGQSSAFAELYARLGTRMYRAARRLVDRSADAEGVVQPIVVRPVASGNNQTQRYEIVAGERRWRAAQMAGLHDIPALIRDIPDESAIAMALIENIQREDLNPLEESRALDRLIREFNLTHAEAAETTDVPVARIGTSQQ
jgi:ParB/RepB/Spo0J family partition protein